MNTKTTPRNKMTGFLMRGHIDISDIEQYPDSNYWAMGARGAMKQMRTMSGCRIVNDFMCMEENCRVDSIADKFWNDDNTWMEICLKTERTRNLLELIRSKS
jgi:hypothetical protein